MRGIGIDDYDPCRDRLQGDSDLFQVALEVTHKLYGMARSSKVLHREARLQEEPREFGKQLISLALMADGDRECLCIKRFTIFEFAVADLREHFDDLVLELR